MIPYSTQFIDDDDVDSVVSALKGEYVTQGMLVESFEKKIAEYLGVKFAVVFNSATSALNIAYKILSIDGFKAITTPLTFCATSNMMLENNITPVFCGCNNNGNIDVKYIKKILNENDNIKAIVSVDFAGNSVDIDEILDICRENNLYFVSDSSHSFGGEYKGKKIGNFADMTIFSFHALKPITTIEGGAIVTNNEEFYIKAKLFRSHGIKKTCLWDSQLDFVGYNFRLSDVACALGISQLKKLDSFIEKRNQIARFYDDIFKDNLYFNTIKVKEYIKSTYHLYPILLNRNLWCNKEEIFRDLLSLGIGVQVHYKPIYQFNLYKNSYQAIDSIENFYKSEISIPCHQKMTLKDAEFVSNSLLKVLETN